MDGRDYSRPGWCFVTLGADYHKSLFGEVVGCEMCANELGRLVEQCWSEIPQHYGHIELGAWQVMPNHFHGLVRITRSGGKGLGEVMNIFKGAVTREWRRAMYRDGSRYSEKEQEARVWAPNYYDVICFKAEDLEVRRRYVLANPRRWALKEVPVGFVRKSRYKGNVDLLNEKKHRALRVSRKSSQADVEKLQNELLQFEGIICSTFFSPGEQLILEALLNGKARLVWILPMAMPKNISVKWTDAFLDNMALWISPFSDDLYNATRESCTQANQWIESFCKRQ